MKSPPLCSLRELIIKPVSEPSKNTFSKVPRSFRAKFSRNLSCIRIYRAHLSAEGERVSRMKTLPYPPALVRAGPFEHTFESPCVCAEGYEVASRGQCRLHTTRAYNKFRPSRELARLLCPERGWGAKPEGGIGCRNFGEGGCAHLREGGK